MKKGRASLQEATNPDEKGKNLPKKESKYQAFI
jgi:hypothetical protein